MFYGSFVLLGFGPGGCTALALMVTVVNWFYKRVGVALGVMSSGFGASGSGGSATGYYAYAMRSQAHFCYKRV